MTQSKLKRMTGRTEFWIFLVLTLSAMFFCSILAVYLGRHLRGMKPEDVIPVLQECPTPLCCGLMTVAPFALIRFMTP